MGMGAQITFPETDLVHGMKPVSLNQTDRLKKFVTLAVLMALSVLGLSAEVFADGGQTGGAKVMAQNQQRSNNLIVSKMISAEKSEKLEIERKFLIDVKAIPQKLYKQGEQISITQTYINHEPEIRVRQLNQDGDIWYMFAMKLPKDTIGLSRDEMEFEITQDVYYKLLRRRLGTTIHKTRLEIEEKGHYISVDIYQNKELDGLAVVEVEFDSLREAETFKPLAWFGKDITADKRYKNAGLARYGKPK